MKSLKYLYKIGNGPSSSHTMGPKNACLSFIKEFNNCNHYVVTLYNSLALTGKGHLTDYIIKETLKDVKIIFDFKTLAKHPNTMDIKGYLDDKLVGSKTYYSVGGGAILTDDTNNIFEEDIYKELNFYEVEAFIKKHNLTLDGYVDYYEQVDDYLDVVLKQMLDTVKKGLESDEIIPGKLKLRRKAKILLKQKSLLNNDNNKIMAYAYATAEENASGGLIVTAPTCGASGVLPAIIYYFKELKNTSKDLMIKGLKIAGMIGNIIKQNGSISGAEAGCQAEIGTACSMAAAYSAYILGGSIKNIERAAEIALEHHLGLTCDPVGGYVQIPCIERNAVAALRAIDAATLALSLNDNDAKISFDMVVSTMLETGVSLAREYRETSQGGLAKRLNLGDNNES